MEKKKKKKWKGEKILSNDVQTAAIPSAGVDLPKGYKGPPPPFLYSASFLRGTPHSKK